MVYLFGHKKRIERLRSEVHDSFSNVKRDFNKVGEWITHLDDKHSIHKGEIDNIKDQILSIRGDLLEIKDFISFFGPQISKQSSNQAQITTPKQSMSGDVQTVGQTDVQTDVLINLTVMERAIVWALLNSDMKLSYEDIAALLGKDKSTIRGQINTIRQKSPGVIEESRELNGKKRLHISENVRNNVLKSIKVKIKNGKPKK